MNSSTYTQEVVNLHTHSYYCGHGFGEVAEYAEKACMQHLHVLGMSEHCPVSDERWVRTRMPFAMLGQYNQDCLRTQNEYVGKLEILRGFECDYLPQYRSFYKEMSEQCDYLLFGIHDLSLDIDSEYSVFWNTMTKQDLYTYTEIYLQALQSGLFLFGAHPDVFMYNYQEWDEETKACSKAIIECAVDYNVALEINANGMRKKMVETSRGVRYAYPHQEFWKLASQYPVKVITNSDAHNPDYVNDGFTLCKTFAESCSIEFSSYLIGKEKDTSIISIV
ncbi:MAG: histidinol-phosphatase [Sphaerochaeta sp.]